MGELAHIKTFIEEVTTALVVNTYDTKRFPTGRKNCLVEVGELMSVDGTSYKKRYRLFLRTTTEAIMTGFINEIIDGCLAYSKRKAGLTVPATMCHIEFRYTNKTHVKEGIWKNEIYLDVEWSTS